MIGNRKKMISRRDFFRKSIGGALIFPQICTVGRSKSIEEIIELVNQECIAYYERLQKEPSTENSKLFFYNALENIVKGSFPDIILPNENDNFIKMKIVIEDLNKVFCRKGYFIDYYFEDIVWNPSEIAKNHTMTPVFSLYIRKIKQKLENKKIVLGCVSMNYSTISLDKNLVISPEYFYYNINYNYSLIEIPLRNRLIVFVDSAVYLLSILKLQEEKRIREKIEYLNAGKIFYIEMKKKSNLPNNAVFNYDGNNYQIGELKEVFSLIALLKYYSTKGEILDFLEPNNFSGAYLMKELSNELWKRKKELEQCGITYFGSKNEEEVYQNIKPIFAELLKLPKSVFKRLADDMAKPLIEILVNGKTENPRIQYLAH